MLIITLRELMKLGDLVVYLKPLVLDFRQGVEAETELKLKFDWTNLTFYIPDRPILYLTDNTIAREKSG